MDWKNKGIVIKRFSYSFQVVNFTILISWLLKTKVPKNASMHQFNQARTFQELLKFFSELESLLVFCNESSQEGGCLFCIVLQMFYNDCLKYQFRLKNSAILLIFLVFHDMYQQVLASFSKSVHAQLNYRISKFLNYIQIFFCPKDHSKSRKKILIVQRYRGSYFGLLNRLQKVPALQGISLAIPFLDDPLFPHRVPQNA